MTLIYGVQCTPTAQQTLVWRLGEVYCTSVPLRVCWPVRMRDKELSVNTCFSLCLLHYCHNHKKKPPSSYMNTIFLKNKIAIHKEQVQQTNKSHSQLFSNGPASRLGNSSPCVYYIHCISLKELTEFVLSTENRCLQHIHRVLRLCCMKNYGDKIQVSWRAELQDSTRGRSVDSRKKHPPYRKNDSSMILFFPKLAVLGMLFLLHS